jgi:hypothetical protein
VAQSFAQKLNLKPGEAVALLNAPQGYDATLSTLLGDNPVAEAGRARSEAVIAFCNSLAEAEKVAARAIRLTKPDGLLWLAYPKQSSKVKTDVNRDTLWKAVEATGWRPVRQVALDATWSALRFRPAEDVGT